MAQGIGGYLLDPAAGDRTLNVHILFNGAASCLHQTSVLSRHNPRKVRENQPGGTTSIRTRREEITLLRAQGYTMRMSLAVSGEQRRPSPAVAAQRRNPERGLEYRASMAQWHAERSARRPKQAKLAFNAELQAYVEERLAGVVITPARFLFPARP